MTRDPSEKSIQNRIRIELSDDDTRLFRQQSGDFWAGDATVLHNDAVLIRNPRRVSVGFPGLSDLGGWRTVEITPDMVGQKVAVYVAIEVKAKRGRPTNAQLRFIDVVNEAGGMAGVARSVDDAAEILRKKERA